MKKPLLLLIYDSPGCNTSPAAAAAAAGGGGGNASPAAAAAAAGGFSTKSGLVSYAPSRFQDFKISRFQDQEVF